MKPDFLIIGLGNPGKEHALTRHNAGWMALDLLQKKWGAGEWEDRQKFLCMTSEATVDGKNILLVKPTTYMNRSGECVRKLVEFYKLDAAKSILVTCDDIDLPLGTHRFRMNGGPGTHNGLRSIVDSIGEAFPRHRIGIGAERPPEMDLAAWVLSRMSEDEIKTMTSAMETLKQSYEQILHS